MLRDAAAAAAGLGAGVEPRAGAGPGTPRGGGAPAPPPPPHHHHRFSSRKSTAEHTIPRTSTHSWDRRFSQGDGENKDTIIGRLLLCVDSWAAQILYLVATLVHSSTYYFSWEDFRLGETVTTFSGDTTLDTREVELIFTSGAILFAMTVYELYVRISAQGGSTLWRWAPWRKFFRLKFHQIEALILFSMTFRSIQTTYLFALWVFGNEEGTETINATEDQVTVSILVFYRFFRAWGIWFNITVQAEKDRARRRKHKRGIWHKEHIDLKGKKKECKERAERLFNSLVFQAWVILLVFIHFFLYSIQRRFQQGWYWIITGYFLALLYSIEFLFRCVAQGNIEQFLTPCLHKFDFFLLVLGLLLLGYTTVYYDSFQESREIFEPLGVWSVLLLLAQRAVRVFEVWQEISALDTSVNSLTVNVAMNKFLAKFGDVLRIPKQNVQINGSKIIGEKREVTLTIHKAELEPEAFKGLHLPISIRGGLMEELVFTHKPFEGFTRVKIENALLMLGPGEGLAEAGGFEPAGTYWNAERISEAKSKLVELICAHLAPPRPSRAQATQGRSPAEVPHDDSTKRVGPTGSKTPKGSRSRIRQRAKNYVYEQYVQLKQKYTDLMKDFLFKRVEVQIKNVRVQYDDADGILCSDHVVIGAKVGSISGCWEKGKEILGDVCRFGIYCERKPTQNTPSMPGSYGTIGSIPTATTLASSLLQSIRSSFAFRSSVPNVTSVPRSSVAARWTGTNTEQSLASSRSSDGSPGHRWGPPREAAHGSPRKTGAAASTFDSGNTMVRRTTTLMTQASARVRTVTRWGIISGESRQQAKEAWRRDLYNRVLDAPQEAIRELVRLNWLEYLQLWVLEYVDQELRAKPRVGAPRGERSWAQHELRQQPEGKEETVEQKRKPESDWRRHRRREVFQNHNNVFMLMKLELDMRPDAETFEETPNSRNKWSRVSSGKRDSTSSARDLQGDKEDRGVSVAAPDEPTKAWIWRIKVPFPARVVVSEEQTRCLRTLMLCLKSWTLHDKAFRWHPDLELGNPNVQLYEESGMGRKTLVRMWWIYAVHRVLARLQRRPVSTTIQLFWRANNFRRYKALVRCLAKRTTAKGATATASEKSLQPNKWEAEMLRCYQMHLHVADIVMIRRQGLAIIAGKDVAALASGSKGSLTSSGRPPFTASNTREALATIEATEEEDSAQDLEAPQSEGYLSRGSTVRNLGGSASYPLTRTEPTVHFAQAEVMEPRPQVELPEESMRRSDSAKSGMSSETAAAAEDLIADGPLSNIAGHWEFTCAGAEVMFLSGIIRPRKRAIHAKVAELLFDMNVVATPVEGRITASPSTSSTLAANQSGGLAPFLTGVSVSFTFTVDDFAVTSPDDQALLLGGLPDVVRVVKPVQLSAPKSKSGLLPGRRVDQEVVFAMRGRGQARKGGMCEVQVPDLQVVVYEPLLLLLLSYVKCEKPSFDRPSVDRRWERADRQLYAKWAARLSGQARNSVVERRAPIPLGGRSSLHLPEQDAVLVAAARTDLHTHADRIQRATQLLKQVHSNQVLFEKVAGALGLDLEADLHLRVGAIQCMEVLAYTEETLVVVQERIWPFYAKGATSEAEAPLGGVEGDKSQARGRSDALARWRRNLSIAGNGFQEAQMPSWDDPPPVQPPPATIMAPTRSTLSSWSTVMANLGETPASGGSPGWWPRCGCSPIGEQEEVEAVEPAPLLRPQRRLFSRGPQDLRRGRARRGTSMLRPDVLEELNKTAACDVQVSVLAPEAISDSVCWLSLQAKEFQKQVAEARAAMSDGGADEERREQ